MKQTLRGWPNGINRTGRYSIDRVRRNRVLLAVPLLWILSMASALLEAQPSAPEKVLAISTTWSATGVKAGSNLTLAIALDIKKPYHINANATKEPFMPTFAAIWLVAMLLVLVISIIRELWFMMTQHFPGGTLVSEMLLMLV